MSTELKQKALSLIREYDMCPEGETVLCALSGGADSMCLLHLLKELSGELGFRLQAAHFNHQMRDTAERDARFVQDICRQWEIPCTIGTGNVPEFVRETHRSAEEAARELRYRFLADTAEKVGAARIVTAHHADDNLETLLLHLVRGSGLHGLTGIPPRRDNIVRPLLSVSRDEILAYLEEREIPHVEDETNLDLSNPRNRIRHEVIPSLKKINPQAIAAVERAQTALRQDDAYLRAQAARAVLAAMPIENGVSVYKKTLMALPGAVGTRAVQLLIDRAGGDSASCTAFHLSQVLALCREKDPSAKIDLPAGMEARSCYELLVIRKRDTGEPEGKKELTENEPLFWNGWQLMAVTGICPEKTDRRENCYYLNKELCRNGVYVRSRENGDRCKLSWRQGSKSLKKWLIEIKVPQFMRDTLPVICDADDRLLAAAEVGTDEHAEAKAGQECLCLMIVKRG